MSKSFFILSSSLLILSACSGGDDDGGTPITVQPKANCSSVTSYTGGITITGNGVYQFRTNGNGAVNGAPSPIRNAEVVVYDAAGEIVQCGSTDITGAFSVDLPNPATNFKLRINSRIHTSLTQIFVLNNPVEKADHYIEKTFTASANGSIGTLSAPATGALQGGAFNILDKMLGADLFLQSSTATCNTDFAGSGCVPFTTHPPLQVFWTAGRMPGEYGGPNGASFYLLGERELYLVGGFDGDTDTADCDHFDNSIIIHEYGHFLEDVVASPDSPGGSHSGDDVIDARLAWGEGWGNFIQAAVLNNPVYRDTRGNPSGSAGELFNVSIENTSSFDDPADFTGNGEGIFREFSIARTLWDGIDNGNDGETVQSPFAEIWAVFSNATNGFASANSFFRSMALFHEVQNGLTGHADWSSIRTNEKQGPASRLNYAMPVSTSGGACGQAYPSIQAAHAPDGALENGTAVNSNQFASNDFYYYNHPGGAFNLALAYTTAGAVDLDLYLFKNNYIFTSSSTFAATPSTTRATASGSTEHITVGNLAAGAYMINVRVYTGGGLGSAATYTMTLNGANLCRN